MADYFLSEAAKEDLIRIHHYGVAKFGMRQVDKYFNSFFKYFEIIANSPCSFQSVAHIRSGYRRCPCGVDTIYFRIKDGTVEIMAIVGRQDLSIKLNQ